MEKVKYLLQMFFYNASENMEVATTLICSKKNMQRKSKILCELINLYSIKRQNELLFEYILLKLWET